MSTQQIETTALVEELIATPPAELFNHSSKSERYAMVRVSTSDQDGGLQYRAINAYAGNLPKGHYFCDKATGRNFNRKKYQRLKKLVKPGDEIILYDVSRLGRNTVEMILEYIWFLKKGVRLRILSEYGTLVDPRPGEERRYIRDNLMWFCMRANQAEADLDMREARTSSGVRSKKKAGGYSGLNHRGVERTHIDAVLFEEQYKLYMKGETTYRKMAQLFPISYAQVGKRVKEKAAFEALGLPMAYDPNKKYAVQLEMARQLYPEAFGKDVA